MVFLGAKNPVTMQLLILTFWPHFYHLIFLLFQIPQTILLWDISPVILYKSVDEGSNYYLDKFLAPKNLGLKVGCFTKNIYFNHSPVTIYKITGEISHNNIVAIIGNSFNSK
jgi:hypothetical protein